ncbi:MAG: acetolactate decarboxylase [Dehalococcoidia bacterium]
MKNIYYMAITILLGAVLLTGCAHKKEDREVIFQVSTIDALLAGIYDQQLLYEDLMKHGDMGLGTFTDLDGEMIGVNGEFYQIRIDGKAYPVDGSMGTPLAVVTYFDPDIHTSLSAAQNYEQLQKSIDDLLPTENIFYAVTIDGTFDYLKVRSVPRQSKPYPPLNEAIKDQAIFEYHDVTGTVVGFRTPAYMSGLNVPGYHFHFISQDKKFGGHVMECGIQSGTVTVDETNGFEMWLPEIDTFYKMDLSGDNSEVLDEVER